MYETESLDRQKPITDGGVNTMNRLFLFGVLFSVVSAVSSTTANAAFLDRLENGFAFPSGLFLYMIFSP